MEDDPQVVLVTGANGFIGRHLANSLEDFGWVVRRAMRTPTKVQNHIRVESIGPTTNWRDSLVGVNAVVHLAARVHHPNEDHVAASYRSINVDGTLHLADCAARAGVKQFVFVSTILVNGRTTAGRGPFSESDIPTPRGEYGRSKAAAESGLKKMSEGSGMNITVVRPPLVYGAGAKGNFNLLFQAVKRGIPLPFASIHNRRAFVSVENLNSFIVERLSNARTPFDVFLVADREQVSTPEFIRRLAVAAGVNARLWPMPIVLLSRMLAISGHPEAYDSIVGSLELDVSKAAATGWRPCCTLDEGLLFATRPCDD